MPCVFNEVFILVVGNSNVVLPSVHSGNWWACSYLVLFISQAAVLCPGSSRIWVCMCGLSLSHLLQGTHTKQFGGLALWSVLFSGTQLHKFQLPLHPNSGFYLLNPVRLQISFWISVRGSMDLKVAAGRKTRWF